MLYEIEAISLLVILTLSLGKGGVSNFLYYKVTFFPLSMLYSLEGDHYAHPTFKQGEL